MPVVFSEEGLDPGWPMPDRRGDSNGDVRFRTWLAINLGCAIGDQAEPVSSGRPQHAHVGAVDGVGRGAPTNNRRDSAVISDINSHMNHAGSAISTGSQHIGSRTMLLRDTG